MTPAPGFLIICFALGAVLCVASFVAGLLLGERMARGLPPIPPLRRTAAKVESGTGPKEPEREEPRRRPRVGI